MELHDEEYLSLAGSRWNAFQTDGISRLFDRSGQGFRTTAWLPEEDHSLLWNTDGWLIW